MTDTWLPSTRLSTAALALGCWKCTWLPLPMLKVCQSTTILFVSCETFIRVPSDAMEPVPDLISPPVGNAPACPGKPKSSRLPAATADHTERSP